MPFLNAALDPVNDNQKTAHACKWVALSEAELNRQLRVCTGEWAEWTGTNPKEGMRYCDMAAWTMEVAQIAHNVDLYQWPLHFMGMQGEGGLEEAFLPAFEHLEKRKYPSEAVFVAALVAAGAKVDRSKLEKIALSENALVECVAVGVAATTKSKEDAVTWGKLRRCGAGGRAMAWLERATCADRHNQKSSVVLTHLFQVLVDRGRVAAACADDEAWAFALVHELANRIVTPPAFYKYHFVDDDRWLDAQARARGAGDQFDGSSAFCQEHTLGLVAVCAPVVANILHGLDDVRAANSMLLELASVFPKGMVPVKPADLFTVHGMKALGRQTAPYAVWAAGAKDSVTSVDERAATFITRVHLNAAVGFVPTGGGAGDGGGGDGAAANAANTNSGMRASGAAWRESLTKVRELDENPAITSDLVRLVSKAGHNPLDMLSIALTGATKAAPTRKSTTLTRMMGIGKINAAALDARLAPLYEYSTSEGGRYLGRAVGDVLVKLHLADQEAVADLRFDKLWEVLAGKLDPKSWEVTLDFYNLLVIELVRQVQCEGTLFDISVAAVPDQAVYTDVLINGRLTVLVGPIFEAMGLPHEGDSSFKEILEKSNAFVSFNGGVTAESTQGARGVLIPPRPKHPLPTRGSPPRPSDRRRRAHPGAARPSAHGTAPAAVPAPRSPPPRCSPHWQRRAMAARA